MPAESANDKLIMSLVERALAQPLHERESFIRRASGGDSALFDQVWSYVKWEERMSGFLALPLIQPDDDEPSSTTGGLKKTDLGHVARPGFTSGTVIDQRYRIVTLLGRGGMGEVYRADDLLLEYPIAIKVLPQAASADANAISRLRNEVRIARQVTHPNVCRVYDIGEAEGLTFLTMEYVDGEDLASLLRRIGKLPLDKGLEVARKLCAGLAAAHEKGVIHRDLKPANIMLDGKGHVRITDFGLAGLVDQIRDAGSGTPPYMSPEQLAGKEVTARSDIYALGIVLHELLTGKRPPLRAGEGELDSTTSRVIGRCLEVDPKMRPATPLAVAAALSGGDLFAAMRAMGELPAPELVANAGPIEGLRTFAAMACLATVIIGLGLLSILRQRHDLINQIPMENSSQVLASKAREIAKSFGYTERPVDTLYGWDYDQDYLRFARESNIASASPYPPALYFWYRQSSHYPNHSDVDYDKYSLMLEPGMQTVVLDSEGRLLEFHARPSAESSTGNEAPAFAWSRLFAAAGLDSEGFKTVHPELTPTAVFDARTAWTGSAGSNGDLRIEAAAFRGRPVFFRVLGPWARPKEPQPFSFGSVSAPMFISFVLALLTAAGLLAWKNARNGRGDRHGAFRLAGFLFLFTLLDNLAGMHHVPTLEEFDLLFAAIQHAVAFGCFGWLLYIALEPQVRKQSPESLISWNRLLAGRFRDPMVGGHLLMGVALGILALAAVNVLFPLPFLATFAPFLPWSNAGLLSRWFELAIIAMAGGLSYALLMNLISIPIRSRWLAGALFVLVGTLVLVPGYGRLSVATVARPAIVITIAAVALIRFGILAMVAACYTYYTVLYFPLTTNWSAWYAHATLLAIATLVALALYGFVTTLTRRSRWLDDMDAT
jgi:predicted Ser/Thr protein kinase